MYRGFGFGFGFHNYGNRGPSGPPPIGGLPIGAEGSGYAAGFVLAGGDDFGRYSDVSELLITPSNPAGKYAPTRGCYAASGPRGNTTLGGFETYPGDTGYLDSNRGVPVSSVADMISIVNGMLRLQQRARIPASEAAMMNRSFLPLSSMIATNFAHAAKAPCIIEWSEVRQANSSSHIAGWGSNITVTPSDGIEMDMESENANGLQVNQNLANWTAGSAVFTGGTVLTPGTTETVYAFKFLANGNLEYYVGGTLRRTYTGDPTKMLREAFRMFWTNHCYDAVKSNFATPAPYSIRWHRWYRDAAGVAYRPLTNHTRYAADFNTAFSFTLPSQAALWGVTGKTEKCKAWMMEENEPGGDATVGYSTVPAGWNLNMGTMTLSGTESSKAGRLHFARWIEEAGSYVDVHHFYVDIGPNIQVTDASLTFSNGQAVSRDIYELCDCGTLVTDGVGKTEVISISGLSGSGLSYSDTTGLLEGTMANYFSGSVTITSTNSVGQVAQKTRTLSSSPAAFSWRINGDLVGELDPEYGIALVSSRIDTWANRANPNDVLTAFGTPANITKVAGAINGRALVRLVRNITSSTVIPRMIPNRGFSSPLSKVMNGDDKSLTIIFAMKPTDSNTRIPFAWGETLSSSDYRHSDYVSRNATGCSVEKQAGIASAASAPYGSGWASGVAKIVAVRYEGTTVSVWERTGGVTTKVVDAAALNVGDMSYYNRFVLFCRNNMGSAFPTYALTQGNEDRYWNLLFKSGLAETTITGYMMEMDTVLGGLS